MRQFIERPKAFNLISPALPAADTTLVEADITGFDSVDVHLQIGVGGITFDATNKIEFKLTKAPAAGGSYIACTADDVILPSGYAWASGGIIYSLTSAHAAWEDFIFSYIGGPAYPAIKLLADFSGTHGTGTGMSALALAYRGRLNPPL